MLCQIVETKSSGGEGWKPQFVSGELRGGVSVGLSLVFKVVRVLEEIANVSAGSALPQIVRNE